MKKFLQLLAIILIPSFQILGANVTVVKDSVSGICNQVVHFSNTNNTYAGSGMSGGGGDVFLSSNQTFTGICGFSQPINGTSTNASLLEGSTGAQLIAGLANTGSVAAIESQTNNWNTAFGWGNHASAGYANTGSVALIESRLIIHTNTGVANFAAAVTQLVSITGMEGNAWSFKKPILWTTNTSFSATAKVSLFDSPNLFGCQEVWRNDSVALASVYNTIQVTSGVYQVTVADETPFSTVATPFQIIILDSTTNECLTVTNVASTVLNCAWPTRYGHAVSNVVSLAPTLNIPGWINDESGANTLRMHIGFSSAQTVGIGYQIPYMKLR